MKTPDSSDRARNGRAPFIIHPSYRNIPSGTSFIIAALLAASLGCSSTIAVAPSLPTGTPTPTPTSSVITTGAKGTLAVTVKDNLGQGVANVVVQVRGTVTLDALTDGQGTVQFADVPAAANYTVFTAPPGFGAASRSQITVSGDQGSAVTLQVAPVAAISGQILKSNGQPVVGAVVSDGTSSTLTRDDGVFVLSGISSGARDVNVAKTGFQPGSKTGISVSAGNTAQMGTLTLAPLGRPLQVLFDAGKSPLGSAISLSNFFADLISALQGQGYQVTIGPGGTSLASLANVDILVITAPGQAYSSSEMTAINNFVGTGHKLILLGEWNGLSGVSNSVLNSLAGNFNLSVGGDLVKDFDAANQITAVDPDTRVRAKRADYVAIKRLLAHPLTANVRSLAVFESATVSVLRPPVNNADPNGATIVARTGLQGLQVAQLFNSNFGVLGVALSGTGTVVVSGDASLWSSIDSDSTNAPDLQRLDNRTMALNAFAW